MFFPEHIKWPCGECKDREYYSKFGYMVDFPICTEYCPKGKAFHAVCRAYEWRRLHRNDGAIRRKWELRQLRRKARAFQAVATEPKYAEANFPRYYAAGYRLLVAKTGETGWVKDGNLTHYSTQGIICPLS